MNAPKLGVRAAAIVYFGRRMEDPNNEITNGRKSGQISQPSTMMRGIRSDSRHARQSPANANGAVSQRRRSDPA